METLLYYAIPNEFKLVNGDTEFILDEVIFLSRNQSNETIKNAFQSFCNRKKIDSIKIEVDGKLLNHKVYVLEPASDVIKRELLDYTLDELLNQIGNEIDLSKLD